MYPCWGLGLGVYVFVSLYSHAFELQDTIHTLIEENIHLHDQLENLTAALRELRRFLLHHNGHDHKHDADLQHLWKEWTQHSVSRETHVWLEQALCGQELHASSSSTTDHISLFITLSLIFLTQLLL